MEAVRKPGRRVGVEVPADSVSAVLLKSLEGVNGVALGLGHLLSVLIKHKTQNKNVLVGRAVEDKGGDCHQGVEPASCLVDALGDEVRWELALEELLILEGVVPLGKGH